MLYATIDLSGFHRAVEKTHDELLLACRDAVREAAQAGAAEAKVVGPFTDRTGNLRKEIVARFINNDGNSIEWEILSPMFYSRWVNKGTSRSRAFPFMDPGAEHARKILKRQLPTEVRSRLSRVWHR